MPKQGTKNHQPKEKIKRQKKVRKWVFLKEKRKKSKNVRGRGEVGVKKGKKSCML